MTVHVITDSSSCLPRELADAAGVTVVDLYTSGQGAEKTTAGLGALELTANYARLLERSGDEGVVALHLSKELSSTWSNAVTAAGVLEGKVRVMDTNTAGMTLGYAALEAARVARAGGSLDEVADAADRVLSTATLWLYVHKIDSLRRGGRLSTARTLLTTALAIKPILKLADGELQLAAKTRTQAKAMAKLVEMASEVVVAEVDAAAEEGRKPRRMKVGIMQSEAVEPANHLKQMIEGRLAELPAELVERALKTEKSKKSEKAEKADKADKATKTAQEATAETADGGDSAGPTPPALPEVDVELYEVSEGLAVHTGPGAIGVAMVCE
ncbi:DegV family protein [Corynebacterium sp.]|uniref:DegV family protein n=1 Tax=Corynebacterium sp. TaxID=1720 RepID=UPI00261E2DE0|nr:DegV family protein [Corynebacterium sp.]